MLGNPLLLAVPWLLRIGRSEGLAVSVLDVREGWRLAIGIGVLFFVLRLADAIFLKDLYEPALLALFGGDPGAHGERYAHLTGDLAETLRWIGLVWLFAALGEELFFRGLMLRQAERLLGGGALATLLAVAFSSLIFGLMHLPVGAWQAVSSTIAGAFFFAAAYILARRNLIAPILAHGLWNSFGLTMIYFGAS